MSIESDCSVCFMSQPTTSTPTSKCSTTKRPAGVACDFSWGPLLLFFPTCFAKCSSGVHVRKTMTIQVENGKCISGKRPNMDSRWKSASGRPKRKPIDEFRSSLGSSWSSGPREEQRKDLEEILEPSLFENKFLPLTKPGCWGYFFDSFEPLPKFNKKYLSSRSNVFCWGFIDLYTVASSSWFMRNSHRWHVNSLVFPLVKLPGCKVAYLAIHRQRTRPLRQEITKTGGRRLASIAAIPKKVPARSWPTAPLWEKGFSGARPKALRIVKGVTGPEDTKTGIRCRDNIVMTIIPSVLVLLRMSKSHINNN